MNIKNGSAEGEDNSFDLRYLSLIMVKSWPWFFVSIVACITATYLYLHYATPIYKISARLAINDENKANGGIETGRNLSSLSGLIGSTSTVDDEAEVFKTRLLMEEVVRSMDLNITYYIKNRLKKEELEQGPFIIKLLSPPDSINGGVINIKCEGDKKVKVEAKGLDTIINFNSEVKLFGVGLIKIVKRNGESLNYNQFLVEISSIDGKVSEIMSKLTVAVTNKQVSVIDLSLDYPLKSKGENILRTLIDFYVRGNISDKNKVADSTIKFIQNRLSYIGGELGDVENNIEGFKSRNNLANMSEQSKMLVQNTSEFSNQLASIETQISVLNSLEAYLKTEGDSKRVIPSSLLPSDLLFSSLIQRYNSLLQEKESQLLSVKPTNPIISNMDTQISNLRLDMLESLTSTKKGLVISKGKIMSRINEVEARMKAVPKTEKDYLQLARTQQIKEELYVFLMQKLEETAISKTSNISNSRVIDPPKSEVTPFSPKKNIFYALGSILGFLIPIGCIISIEYLNDKVKSKDDIIRVTAVAIIGEISHNIEHSIVSSNTRSAISEQFRALRTNLSFYLKDESKKVILLTSSMSGEGKSFTSINLANVLALAGNNVVLIELDLRKPGLSKHLNLPNINGFTSFVIDKSMQVSDIIRPSGLHESISFINSGPIPPNPAELILSKRTTSLINELKQSYDYVIIDSPPIGIVTDAQLLSASADICLYLVRQGYTLKRQLNIVENLSNDGKMHQLGLVVNDIKPEKGYGYGYGYGSEYGTYN